VELKLKANGSMRQATSDPFTLTVSFLLYYVLRAFYSFSLLSMPINRTQGVGAYCHFF
jgi:hypothetical protein